MAGGVIGSVIITNRKSESLYPYSLIGGIITMSITAYIYYKQCLPEKNEDVTTTNSNENDD